MSEQATPAPADSGNVATSIPDPAPADGAPSQPTPAPTGQVDATATPPAAPILGKFKTAEDRDKALTELVNKLGPDKAYKALESQLGKPGDQALTVEAPPSLADMRVEQVLERAGVDGEKLAQEWIANNGKLTDETYEKFKKIGVSRDMVDMGVRGQQVQHQQLQQQQDQIRNRAVEIAGGEQQLNNMLQFATSLPEHRRQDLNRRLADPSLYEGAIAEIAAEHQRSIGADRSQPLIGGTGPASVNTAGFISRSEMLAAQREATKKHGNWMNDPVYKQRLLNTPKNIRTGAK